MLKKLCFIFCFLGGFALTGDGTLYVPDKAPFSEGLRVRDNIRNECNIESLVANDIAKEAYSAYSAVSREKGAGATHVLEIEIIDIFGAGGGAWSGPKYIELKGVLKSGSGNVVGDFTAYRYSMGGALGAIKGTCGILRRVSRALGQDIGVWLTAPSRGARLGD